MSILTESDSDFKYKRVLIIYRKLMNGEVINKKCEAEHFNVDIRSIQRDIAYLRYFFKEKAGQGEIMKELVYSKKLNGYHLINISDYEKDKSDNNYIQEDINMAENETKKKSTTKKTTSTNTKASKDTLSLNEVKEKLDNIPVSVSKDMSIKNTLDESIDQVRKDINNSTKGITNMVNSGTNNILLTIKAESVKTSGLIKDQIQKLDLSSIDKCLETYKNIEAWQHNIIDKMDIIHEESTKDVEQLEKLADQIKIYQNILNTLNDKTNLIMDSITNDPNNDLSDHIEQMLVAQNNFMKNLMENNNDRIDLNSERLNIIIGSVSSMSKNIRDNHDAQIDLIHRTEEDISKAQHNMNAGFDKIGSQMNILEEKIDDLIKQNNSNRFEFINMIEEMNRRLTNGIILNSVISSVVLILLIIIIGMK